MRLSIIAILLWILWLICSSISFIWIIYRIKSNHSLIWKEVLCDYFPVQHQEWWEVIAQDWNLIFIEWKRRFTDYSACEDENSKNPCYVEKIEKRSWIKDIIKDQCYISWDMQDYTEKVSKYIEDEKIEIDW